MIFYRDLEKLMAHVSDGAGVDALLGMANLTAWAAAPSRALVRFEVRTPRQDLRRDVRLRDQRGRAAGDHRDAVRAGRRLCSTATCRTRDKHRVMRGMLAFLAVNSTYRGPYSPGSATCLAFALATPPGVEMIRKLKGGIGAITRPPAGEVRVVTAASSG